MAQVLRKKIGQVSNYLEIVISVIILIGIAIMSAQLFIDIIIIIKSITVSEISMTIPFENFMGDALKLIIGIEFVNMLVRHSPEAVVEVLLFAIARKLIIGTSSPLEIVIGIGAIAILFVVRRFLFFDDEKRVMSKLKKNT